MMLRDDVEDRGARDLFRTIEAHAVQHAGAAIVPGAIELVEAELLHHVELILAHGAERIVLVIVAARHFFGIAITAQVSGDDGEFLRKFRREFLPRQMAERIAVQKEKRRAFAALERDDAGARGLDLALGKAFEKHRASSPLLLLSAVLLCSGRG